MASTCISSCVNDAAARVPVRATYVNLYKWPESDFEFVKSMSRSTSTSSSNVRHGNNRMYGHPTVVDSFSCRQLYLRSYTFSREEDYADDKSTIKCLGKNNSSNINNNKGNSNKDHKVADGGGSRKRKKGGGGRRRRKCGGLRRVTCSALGSIFRRLLSCTTKVDVVN